MKIKLLLCLVIASFALSLLPLGYAGTFTFDSGITWLLPAYGTIVNFGNNYTIDTFYWDLAGTTVYFGNMNLATGSTASLIGFSVQNANLTVTKILDGDQKIICNFTGTSPVGLSIIYSAGIPSSMTIDDVEVSFAFDGLTTTSITVLASTGTVIVDYVTVVPETFIYTVAITASPTFLTNVPIIINETNQVLPYTITSTEPYDWVLTASLTASYSDVVYNFQSWTINSSISVSTQTLTLSNAGNSTVQANYMAGTTFVWPSGGTPRAFYFRSNIQTVRSITGYGLGDAPQGTDGRTDGEVTSGEHTSTYGFRAYIVNFDNSTNELSPGYPVPLLTRTSNGSGVMLAYWNSSGGSGISSAYGLVDGLLLQIYQRWDGNDWSLRGTFISDAELLFKIAGGTWTFSIWTSYTDYVTSSVTSYSWGAASTSSSVTIFTSQPNTNELQSYYLASGNLVGFTMTPYTFAIRAFNVDLANTIPFAFFIFIIDITLYIRTESWVAVSLITMLFCGSGGVVTGMIPALGLGLAWGGFAFGLAILLFRLLKGRPEYS